VEQTYTIYRPVSRRRAAPSPAVVIVIALATLCVWAVSHPSGTPAWAQSKQQTTTQSVPLRPRLTTSVLVLNGNGIAGLAGRVSSRLLARGYRDTPTANARVTTYARSVVLYRSGWQSEAERLAKDAHIRAVAPLDGPLSTAGPRPPLVLILGR